jgi:hypothetical protein
MDMKHEGKQKATTSSDVAIENWSKYEESDAEVSTPVNAKPAAHNPPAVVPGSRDHSEGFDSRSYVSFSIYVNFCLRLLDF